jgi:hypothetical protein
LRRAPATQVEHNRHQQHSQGRPDQDWFHGIKRPPLLG